MSSLRKYCLVAVSILIILAIAGLVRSDMTKSDNVGIDCRKEEKANSWPWMAKVIHLARKYVICDASLLSRRYVLTAAHCVDTENGKLDLKNIGVLVGAHSLSNDGVMYRLESVRIHPRYKPLFFYNDLCLLKLDRLVELTEVHPVCLPSCGLLPKLDVVTVTGWRATSPDEMSSKVLQEVEMHNVSLKQCNEFYNEIASGYFPKGITNQFICAGEKQGGKDACQLASGAPMVAKLTDSSWVQVGIASIGVGCGHSNYLGLYTRLCEYIGWIREFTDLKHS